MEQLERMRRSDLVYVKVKELSQRTCGGKKEDSIQSREGVLLTEPREVSGRWIEYKIEELYAKDDKPYSVPLKQEEEVEAGRLGLDILMEESEKAMQQLKNGNSQGGDGIPVEMVKAMGPESMNAFVKLFSNIYKTRVWCKDWLKSILVRIEKRPQTARCDQHSTSSLVVHASKVIFCVRTNRIKHKARDYMGRD